MNVDIRRLLKNLLIFIVILIVLDRGIGFLLEYAYKHQKLGSNAITTYAIEKSKEDILIFGSSRASHHYDSNIITDSTGLSAYNCGRDGTNIIYSAAILPEILERHNPKLIVLDLTLNEFSQEEAASLNEMLPTMLLPYINTSKQIENTVLKVKPDEVYKAKISKIYAYNSLLTSIVMSYMNADIKNVKGYQPLTGSRLQNKKGKTNNEFKVIKYEKVDDYARSRLVYFVQQVQSRNIPMIAVMTPMYTAPFAATASMKEMEAILNKYHVPFYDYSTRPAFFKKELFHDNSHMNRTGATMFTDSLVPIIKQRLGIS